MEQRQSSSRPGTPGEGQTTGSEGWLAPQGPREGLGHYVEVVREHLLLIGACMLVATVAAGLYTKVAHRTWEAESRLLVTPVNGEASLIGLGLITNTGDPTGTVSTAASFVTTPEVGDLVAQKLHGTSTGSDLGAVSAVPVASSNVIAITAKASTAARAHELANAFATGTVESRTQTLHRSLEALITSLRARVAALPASQRTGQGSLGERLAVLEGLRAGPDPTISVETLSAVPSSPSWPKTKLTLVAGLLVGLVIGLTAAFVKEGLDPRVHREESLRRIFRLPVLARIPRQRSSTHLPLRPDELSVSSTEGYRMLRAALGGRGPSRAIMVTSSSSSEGKSTVSLNLAATLAAAGKKVILIESDVRRASLAAALGVSVDRGVAAVLLEDVPMEDALTTVDDLGENLEMLLVERSMPALGDGLLAGSDQLVESAKALAEFVIFDAPPVNDVSDVVALTRQVDDVLIVARLGHSRADQLVDLGELLMRQGVRPAGLVIVGEETGRPGSYYGYAPQAPEPRGSLRMRKRTSPAHPQT